MLCSKKLHCTWCTWSRGWTLFVSLYSCELLNVVNSSNNCIMNWLFVVYNLLVIRCLRVCDSNFTVMYGCFLWIVYLRCEQCKIPAVSCWELGSHFVKIVFICIWNAKKYRKIICSKFAKTIRWYTNVRIKMKQTFVLEKTTFLLISISVRDGLISDPVVWIWLDWILGAGYVNGIQ